MLHEKGAKLPRPDVSTYPRMVHDTENHALRTNNRTQLVLAARLVSQPRLQLTSHDKSLGYACPLSGQATLYSRTTEATASHTVPTPLCQRTRYPSPLWSAPQRARHRSSFSHLGRLLAWLQQCLICHIIVRPGKQRLSSPLLVISPRRGLIGPQTVQACRACYFGIAPRVRQRWPCMRMHQQQPQRSG